MKLEEANDTKVTTMSFHSTKPCMYTSVIVSARPQYRNGTSNFVQDTECAASAEAGKSTYFTGFVVYGVSAKIEDVHPSICEFLSYNIDNFGLTNTNPNTKYWLYQIIGGYCAVTIGTCVIDSNILRLSGISTERWRLIDFEYDLLVLKLDSHDMVQSLYDYYIFGDTETVTDFSAGDIGLLMVTFVMTNI